MDRRWHEAQQAEAQYWAGTLQSPYQALMELSEHDRQAATRLPNFLADKAKLAAIEIGVGPMGIGFLSVYAADKCSRIVGIEPLPILPLELPDAALSQYLRALRDRVQIVQAKAEKLPLEDNSFDLACCINVLDHTDMPAAVLAELGRVVRPGGLLVLAVHTRSWLGLCKWQIVRRMHAQELFYRAHPHAFLWGQLQGRLQGLWNLLWCDRPCALERWVGHQRMSTWILQRR
jgi:SAM-dependent methyltransferase